MPKYTDWVSVSLKELIPGLDADNPDSLAGKALDGLEKVKDTIGDGFNQFIKDGQGNIVLDEDGLPKIDINSIKRVIKSKASEIPTMAKIFEQTDQLKKMRNQFLDSMDQIVGLSSTALGTWNNTLKRWEGGALDVLSDFVDKVGEAAAGATFVGFKIVDGLPEGCTGRDELKSEIAAALDVLDMGASPTTQKSAAILLVLQAPTIAELNTKVGNFKSIFTGIEDLWTVTFTITDGVDPVTTSTLTVEGETGAITIAGDGTATIGKANGTYTYRLTDASYNTVTGSFTVNNANVSVPITVEAKNKWDITITVADDADEPIEGATVILMTKPGGVLTRYDSGETDANGQVIISALNGTYYYSVSKAFYRSVYDYQTGIVMNGADVTQDIEILTNHLIFTVTDSSNDEPIEGAVISTTLFTGTQITRETDGNGIADFLWPSEEQIFTISSGGYTSQTYTLNDALGGAAIEIAIELTPQ